MEYVNGGVAIVRNDKPWQVSTSVSLSEEIRPECWRYQEAVERLSGSRGIVSSGVAMDLLEAVKQGYTVWSVVYGLGSGSINVAVGQDYEDVHAFALPR